MRLGDLDDLKVHISELILIYSGTELDNAILNAIDNAPTVDTYKEKYEELKEAYRLLAEAYEHEVTREERQALDLAIRTLEERPQGELKEYKPLELDYNVQSAVENLKTAYWSNDYRKYAKVFTDAEGIIVGAICHFDYIVCKRPKGEWEEPFKHNGKIYHRCNQCHVSSPLMLIDNYCSYCGAVMRKGGKE